MIDLLIYFSVFVGATLFLNYRQGNDKTINVVNIIGLIVIIFFAAGRFYVGTDYGNYIHLFSRISELNWFDFFKNHDGDILFGILVKLTYPIYGRISAWAAIAAITTIPVYITLRKEYPKASVSVAMLVFLISYYTTSFNVARQMLAVSLSFVAIKFIYENKFKSFFITILIALGFHATSLVIFPMWFLWDHKDNQSIDGNKKFFLILSIAIACFGYQYVINIFSSNIDYYEQYSQYAEETISGKNRDFYIYALEFIFILFFKEQLKIENSRFSLFFDLLTISILIGLTGFSQPIVKRLAFYYAMPAKMILFGHLHKVFANDKSQPIVKIAIILWFMAQFILTAYIFKQAGLIPYRFNLNNPWYSPW